MRPTAIQADQSTVLFLEEPMVFGAEDLTTERFENDALFWQGFDGFMKAHIATF